MSELSTFAQRAAAAAGAFALTLTLLVSSFATPETVAVAGIFA